MLSKERQTAIISPYLNEKVFDKTKMQEECKAHEDVSHEKAKAQQK